MTGDLILVLDSGTTSTRAIVFGGDGAVHGLAQQELEQHYPRPGWVEHDAAEIRDRTLDCARAAIAQAGGVDRIACIGITNQRETVVAWDCETHEPLARAIVWQDRRTADRCDELRKAGHEAMLHERTGLQLDPYFSATKMRWLLEHEAQVKAAADTGRLAFGTVESWLVHALSDGARISDASNASRTCLLPLSGESWDEELCDMFGVPVSALPQVVDMSGEIAVSRPEVLGKALPITGLAGDQQAATIGQGCLSVGDTKGTFGTGAFVLSNMGEAVPQSDNRLLGTVLCQQDGARTYALEGSVFVAGSLIKWLRDSLGVIEEAADTETLARSVEDNGGVVIVPALSGLGAPHWRPDARASISGLTFAAGRAHIARAALEAMALQTHDLAMAFQADGAHWTTLKIDGGMSANDWMAQDMADILAIPVERPANVETTAVGAAMLAGVGCGLFPNLEDAARSLRGDVRRFEPAMAENARQVRLVQWREALDSV